MYKKKKIQEEEYPIISKEIYIKTQTYGLF